MTTKLDGVLHITLVIKSKVSHCKDWQIYLVFSSCQEKKKVAAGSTSKWKKFIWTAT